MNVVRAGVVGLCAFGCAAEPETPPVPVGPPPKIVQIAPEEPDDPGGPPRAPGSPVAVQLRFTTVGNLHQGFFAEPKPVRALGTSLGGCTGHAVEVDVVWSQDELEGRIFAVVPPSAWSCTPRWAGDGVDLSPAIPAAQALARYRDQVSATSDFRISSFLVGLDLVSTQHTCRIRAYGQYPPDGTRFHPCVLVDGQRVCAAGDPKEGVTRLVTPDPKVAALLREACAP